MILAITYQLLAKELQVCSNQKEHGPGPLWGGNQGLELPPGSVIFNLWLSSTACICPVFLSDHQLVAGDDCSSLSRVLPEVCPC